MFSIVSITYKNLHDIDKTCASVSQCYDLVFEHIIVASGFNERDKATLLERWNNPNRIFIFDQDKSIYNAMNIGLRIAKGEWIFFLNGGDIILDHHSLARITRNPNKSCKAFAVAQRYGQDVYIRYSRKEASGSVSCAHPGFIAYLEPKKSNRIYFNEKNLISADGEWIKKNISRYGVELYLEVLSEFSLGGLSSRPSLKAIRFQVMSKNYPSAIKLIPKLILYLILRPKQYYFWLARYNSYEIGGG